MSGFLRYDAVHPDAMVADSSGEWVPLAEVLRIIDQRDLAEHLAASRIIDRTNVDRIYSAYMAKYNECLESVRDFTRNRKEAPK